MFSGKITLSLIACLAVVSGSAFAKDAKVAIANFGPHPSLTAVVDGFKKGMAESGFAEGKGVSYDYKDASFDPSVVAQMLSSLEAGSPDLILTVTTPITQASKRMIRNKKIPIVFAPVTDPVDAGLVKSWDGGSDRFTGASNLQSMETVYGFAKKLLPKADTVGILFNPGDANDVVNIRYAEAAGKASGVTVKAVSVESAADLAVRVSALKDADYLYVIPSSMLQPALPAIAAAARKIDLPVINASSSGVKDGQIIASLSVSWFDVGRQAGVRAARVLKGESPSDVDVYRPKPEDHVATVSKRYLELHSLELPAALADCNCVK